MQPQRITHHSLRLCEEVGANDMLLACRVLPAGREGTSVFARTLDHGEEDSGEPVIIYPGETLVFRPGEFRVFLQDVDEQSPPGPVGYAPISNTIWTWFRVPPQSSATRFRLLSAAARRLDSAHALCVATLLSLRIPPNTPFLQTRSQFFEAWGHAELMCISLNRALSILDDIRCRFPAEEAFPESVSHLRSTITALRNAFEHIEDRALGNVRGEVHPDALSVFDQQELFSHGVLRYGDHSLSVATQVIPLLTDSRRYLFAAIAAEGTKKFNTEPIYAPFGD